MGTIVHVTAPSRLHFGLLSFGEATERRFGGAGVMISDPSLQLRLSRAEQLAAEGPLAERAVEFARQWAAFYGLGEPACRIEILDAPRPHSGLGSGTQLALSVAAGLNSLLDRPPARPEELASSVGRGRRSAVGTHGFLRGGLIAERGKLPGEPIAPLACRVPLPASWRFVLLAPREQQGLHGSPEHAAFEQLPDVPPQMAQRLSEELFERLIPAARAEDYPAFSRSLYRFGYAAGMCFAEKQGGPYNGPRLSELVELVRSLGVEGVGQSSWGPTLFALTPSPQAAEQLLGWLSHDPRCANTDLWISAPANEGAQVRRDRVA